MAVPTVSASSETNITTATDPLTINLPAHSAGDLLLMVLGIAPYRVMTVPSGWAALYNQSTTGGVFGTLVAYRYATADHGSTVVVDLDGTASALAVVSAIAGAENPATTAIVSAAGGAADGTASLPEITATTSDSLVMGAALKAGGDAWSATPSGYSSVGNISNSTSSDDLLVLRKNDGAAAGTVSSVNIQDTASNRWRSYHIAIAPAASGTSAIPAFVHHRRLLGVQ